MKVKVLVKKPFEDYTSAEIEVEEGGILPNFTNIRKIIGCEIVEQVNLKGFYELIMFIDEEGKLNNSKPNLILNMNNYYEPIVGTVVVCKCSLCEDDLCLHNITDEDEEYFLSIVSGVYYEKEK